MTLRDPLLGGVSAMALLLLPSLAMANFSFAISPPRFELAAKAGEKVRQVIEITNASTKENVLLVRTADWTLRPDATVVFHDDLQPNSCRPWVTIERLELIVNARQPYRFRFEVNPPSTQTPTECRFAIMMEGKDASLAGASGTVPIGARIGVIVYVAIGDVKPDLEVIGARVEVRNGQPTPVLDVRNNGKAHGRLDGFLSATDPSGQTLEASPGNNPILPGETRAIPISLSKRGDTQTAVPARFPLTVKGQLEWAKGQSIKLEKRFEQ